MKGEKGEAVLCDRCSGRWVSMWMKREREGDRNKGENCRLRRLLSGRRSGRSIRYSDLRDWNSWSLWKKVEVGGDGCGIYGLSRLEIVERILRRRVYVVWGEERGRVCGWVDQLRVWMRV